MRNTFLALYHLSIVVQSLNNPWNIFATTVESGCLRLIMFLKIPTPFLKSDAIISNAQEANVKHYLKVIIVTIISPGISC